MKKQCRIVRVEFAGRTSYNIQRRHFLFPWWWVPAWTTTLGGEHCNDSFNTLEEAQKHLVFWDGTKPTETIAYQNFIEGHKQ